MSTNHFLRGPPLKFIGGGGFFCLGVYPFCGGLNGNQEEIPPFGGSLKTEMGGWFRGKPKGKPCQASHGAFVASNVCTGFP